MIRNDEDRDVGNGPDRLVEASDAQPVPIATCLPMQRAEYPSLETALASVGLNRIQRYLWHLMVGKDVDLQLRDLRCACS
jgi:hypothetical protein